MRGFRSSPRPSHGISEIQIWNEQKSAFALNFSLDVTTMDDAIDPLPQIREECKKNCPKYVAAYEACASRIAAKNEGDCESWYFDLLHCVDKCAAPQIFKLTK